MTDTNGTTAQTYLCEVCETEIDRYDCYIPTGTGFRHLGCHQHAPTAPPHTVLARVWLKLRGPEGPYSYAQVEAALRQAMIPPHAPYAEWEAMIPRSLTLLPPVKE